MRVPLHKLPHSIMRESRVDLAPKSFGTHHLRGMMEAYAREHGRHSPARWRVASEIVCSALMAEEPVDCPVLL